MLVLAKGDKHLNEYKINIPDNKIRNKKNKKNVHAKVENKNYLKSTNIDLIYSNFTILIEYYLLNYYII